MSEFGKKLFLFPGLAADGRLFQNIEAPGYETVCPAFVPAEKEESLEDYAKRWVDELQVQPHDLLGGMSFGGQLAMEMAKHAQTKGVIMISANRRASEISNQFRLQNKLLQSLPEGMVRNGLKSVGIPKLKRDERLSDEQVKLLEDMVNEMDMEFFRWSANAVAQWKYEFDPEHFTAPIHQIHGENDPIISISKTDEVDILKGAKHLINFTHVEEVNEWLKNVTHP
jgi:thioesterase domain-containing protein